MNQTNTIPKPKSRDQLHHVLDPDLRVTRWPGRRAQRLAVLAYLASKFQEGVDYTEPAVNALVRHWCTFDDPALIRRELFDGGFVGRTRDGRAYWKLSAV